MISNWGYRNRKSSKKVIKSWESISYTATELKMGDSFGSYLRQWLGLAFYDHLHR